jgi:hypothetical protein
VSRRTSAVVLALPLALVLGGVASAAWTTSGTGSGAGSARSLLAPTAPSAATVSPTSSAIDVSFTPAANPTGTTYTVTRDKTASGSAGATVVCSGLTASPCHDTGLAGSTTFTYTVSAVLGSWSQAAATTPSATTTSATSITLTSCSDDGSNNKSTCVGTYVGSITSITITWTKGTTTVTQPKTVSGGSFSIQTQNGLAVGTWTATATSTSPAATSNSVNVTIS